MKNYAFEPEITTNCNRCAFRKDCYDFAINEKSQPVFGRCKHFMVDTGIKGLIMGKPIEYYFSADCKKEYREVFNEHIIKALENFYNVYGVRRPIL